MKLIITATLAAGLLSTLPALAQSKKVTKAPVTHPVVQKKQTDDEVYLKKHPDIKTFTREAGKVVVLQKTDGTTERYRLDVFADEQDYKKKYGTLPPYRGVNEPTPSEVSN